MNIINNRQRIIVFVIPQIACGGAEKFVLTLSKGLCKYFNTSCHVISFTESKHFKLPNEIYFHYLPVKKSHNIFYYKKCAQMIDNYIINNIGYPNLILANLSETIKIMRYSKLPVYNVIHSTPSIEFLMKRKGLFRLYRKFVTTKYFAYKPSICVSKGVLTDFNSNFKTNQNSICIYNPFDRENIINKSEEKFNENFPPYIIHIGTFNKAKRQDILIKAYARINPKEHLVLIGLPDKSNCYRKCIDLVKKFNLESKIHFIGFKENPYPYLKRAKLFVLSSQVEGLPTVLGEAICLGIPVISTNCKSGPSEFLLPENPQCLVPINDVNSLANKIKEALENPSNYTAALKKCFLIEYACQQYINLCKI